ncbi:MAG: monofunctional biosynthetic peptidoglycan transglycosylase [Deltaproteobacteria bacterium]|nr:monofunctional biosynthetic peptidoglycan transglycosylase [Deltaproteobacteria bacterium]MBW2285890.1 monofunctional biosynthetic peptidoglycan transglycosylase [Deltaproteobacteria bacterium]
MRWSLRLGIRLFLVFVILTLLQVLILRFLNPPFTAAMAVRWVHHTLTGQAYQPPLYYWRDLNAISPYLRQAVLAGEDQRFLRHHGFDFAELNQAIKESISSDRMRGASTITMQTARSVFLWPGRSLARKVLEAYYTGLIELVWTKKRILEMYLNMVDWGTGIMGAQAASKRHFHMDSRRLDRTQAAWLAVILPNPHRWSPARPTPYLKKRQARILADMAKMPVL